MRRLQLWTRALLFLFACLALSGCKREARPSPEAFEAGTLSPVPTSPLAASTPGRPAASPELATPTVASPVEPDQSRVLTPGWYRRTLGGGGGQAGIAIDPTNAAIMYVTTDNGGIVKTTDAGEHWFSINNNIGNGQLGDSELDPLDAQVLYVVAEVRAETPSWSTDPANGELYRTRDGGQTWEIVYAEGMGGDGRVFSVVQWPSTRSLLIPYDPADPGRYDADGDKLSDVIYIGGWDRNPPNADKRAGVWKSTDEGATFQQLGLNDKNIWSLRADPADPETLFAATYGEGLWVSRDGGQSWESWRDRIPNPMTSDVVVDSARHTLYVSTNVFFSEYSHDEYRAWRGLYKSTDGGQSFFSINVGLEDTSLNFETLLLDRSDPTGQTLYTGTFGGTRQGLYKTTSGGAFWLRMPVENVLSPEWFSSFQNLWDLVQGQDGTLMATSWRGIYRFNPDRQRWDLKVRGLGNTVVQTVAFEPGNDSVIYLGMMDARPLKSLDRGATWTTIGRGFLTADGEEGVGAKDFAISPSDPRIIYAVGAGPSGSWASAVNKSTDGGATWHTVTNGLPPTTAEDPQWQARSIVVSAHNPEVAYLALDFKTGGGRLYKTTDGGRAWQELLSLVESPTELAISTTDPETVVCATFRGVVYVSRDGGRQWLSSSIGNASLIYSVDVHPTQSDHILVGTNIHGAYLSTDGGWTWQVVFDQRDLRAFMGDLALSPFARERYWPTIAAVKFDPTDINTLYLGHDPGVWMGVGILRSTDGGNTWMTLGDPGFQMRSVSSFDLNPFSKNLVVGTLEVYYYYAGLD